MALLIHVFEEVNTESKIKLERVIQELSMSSTVDGFSILPGISLGGSGSGKRD